jgi:2-methylcitrate dehydratase PrpD
VLVGPRTFDALGALVAGSGAAEGRAIAAVGAWDRDVAAAVIRRVAITRMTELDDIHMASCTTPGAVVIPTALTVAIALGAGPADYRRAVEVGYEAMTRLGAAIDGPHIVYRGIWPTYFCAPFTAAAVAASLLDLDAPRTVNALGLALTRATGLGSGIAGNPLGRWLTVGDGARSGCAAALAARDGFIADVQIERVCAAAGVRFDRAAFAAEASPAIEQVSVKPMPAAKQCLAAVEAALRMHVTGASRIRVYVPNAYAEMVAAPPSPGSRLSRLSSAQWNVALALLAPAELHDLERSRVDDPELSALASRIEVVGDGELSDTYPLRWPAKVEVAGRSEVVIDATGDPANGNGLKAVDEKWRGRPEQLQTVREAALALDLERLAALLDTLERRR